MTSIVSRQSADYSSQSFISTKEVRKSKVLCMST